MREEIIADQAIEQSIAIVSRLQAEGFTISSKSTVVASSKQLAQEVANGLLPHGIQLTVSEGGRDLGVDFAAGARRRTIIQKARIRKYKAGTRMVIKLGSALKPILKANFFLFSAKSFPESRC